jgi:enamine deaminase RidA (YjgF/YER057c/UK114 family)
MKIAKTLLLLCWLPLAGFSQKDTSLVKFFNPATVSTPKGYSHAAEIDLGTCKMIIISGQVALDQQGNLVGKNDLVKQTEQVFINIREIVTAAGGDMGDVVKLGYFILDATQIQTVRDVRNKFIDQLKPPASTLVQVSKLFRDDILIEVEATAIIPNKR